MVSEKVILDVILAPIAVFLFISYHIYFYIRLKRNPNSTVFGLSWKAKYAWTVSMMRDKRDILAVQTIRNGMMAASSLASLALLISSALAAFIIGADILKEPDAELKVLITVKAYFLVISLLSAFFCFIQAVRNMYQVSYLINVPTELCKSVSYKTVGKLLVKSQMFYTLGSRCFFFALCLILWLFGAIAFLCVVVVVLILLYFQDTIKKEKELPEDNRNINEITEAHIDDNLFQSIA